MIHSISIHDPDPFQIRHNMMMILPYFLLTILLLFFRRLHSIQVSLFCCFLFSIDLKGDWLLHRPRKGLSSFSYGHGGVTSHLLIQRFDWGGLVYLPYATVDNVTLCCLLFSHQSSIGDGVGHYIQFLE